MRILIISPLYYPNKTPRAFRAFELSKEFARLGHEVVVYTDKGTYNYSEFTNVYKITIKDIPNLRYFKAGNSNQISLTFFKRILIKILKYPLYYPDIELVFRIPQAIKHEKYCEMVISIAYPYSSHMAMNLAFLRNKHLANCWIADCGDPFYKNSFSKLPFYFRAIEKWMFKNTDFITIPTILAKGSYPVEFRPKIRVIPQGFDFSDIKLAKYKKNICPTFAYAGMLYKDKRDPTQFLEYLVSITTDFKFYVYTRCNWFFLDYSQRLGEKLIVKDYIERPALIYELSKMDFLINFENDVIEQVPSKLIDYTFAKRPILSIHSKRLNIKTVEEFMSYNFSNQHSLENISMYHISNVANEFLALYNQKLEQN